MEMQFFVQPGSELEWFAKWKETRLKWHKALGMGEDNYRYHDHEKLAHYANAATDIEFNFPFGFKELEGIHSRTDFDLGRHQEFSGKKLQYFDPEKGESYVPYVIETAMGVNRAMLATMLEAYEEEDLGDGKTRTVLKLRPWLSPVKAAVIPLARNVPELLDISNDLVARLRKMALGRIELENSGNIGKNYRRHDEIGTPVCITVDHQTIEDGTVTLRHRDTMAQERIAVADVPARVLEIING